MQDLGAKYGRHFCLRHSQGSPRCSTQRAPLEKQEKGDGLHLPSHTLSHPPFSVPPFVARLPFRSNRPLLQTGRPLGSQLLKNAAIALVFPARSRESPEVSVFKEGSCKGGDHEKNKDGKRQESRERSTSPFWGISPKTTRVLSL